MLSRANKAYEATAPPRNDLSKTLFPSSSPSNNNNHSSQNANIVDSFKRPSQQSKHQASAASVPARTSASTIANSQNSTTRNYGSQSSAHPSNSRTPSMVSLYTKSDSFKDGPDDLLYSESKPKTAPAVEFCEDDFSDFSGDDLEFAMPLAAPQPPPKNSSTSVKHLPESQEPSAPLSTQPIPWSSSPPSHMAPPPSRTTFARTTSTGSSKRGSHEAPREAQAPPAKKRSLPQGWKKSEPNPDNVIDLGDDQDISRSANARVIAQQTKKESTPYDPLSGVDMKQIKKQSKRPTEEDLSMEGIQAIGGGHVEKDASGKGISLSKEQQRVQDLVVKSGNSVFFTGPAGTGKSVLMRSIIAELKKKFARDPERLAVTASTGLAACNIGGITLHSFSGIGLGKDEVSVLAKKIRRNPKAKNRWLRTKVLIIDEISMVDGELFDKLSQLGRMLRNNGRPWGGIQLVITGDFFQLPPVPDTGNDQKKKEAKFAFDANTWSTSIDHTIGLTQVFRQKDPVFANMLNEMRLGRISDESIKSFKSLARPIQNNDGLDLDTTELFPTRTEVERANQSRLRNLSGKPRCYEAHDSGDPAVRDKVLQNMMAPKSLVLKPGAQVMLIKNMDDTLVNGSLGKVKGFITEAMFETKNMGEVSDELGADPFAQSKARIQKFTKQYEEAQSHAPEYPWVEFAASDGTHRTILCMPEDWKVELPTGEVQASRSQVPLILAWALSIHKAQGQTLERVKVDLGKVFEKGQAYVALSRATSQAGLQVMRFEKHKVMAHPRVVDFYNGLYSVDQVGNKKTRTLSEFVNGQGNKNPQQKPQQQKGKAMPPQMMSYLQKKQGASVGAAGMEEDFVAL